jgi:hypothetical protein
MVLDATAGANEFCSSDLVWRGKRSESKFQLTSSDGWQVDFNDGRISKLSKDGKKCLSWHRAKDAISIADGTNRPLLACILDQNGLLQEIRRGSDVLKIEYQRMPVVTQLAGRFVAAGFRPELSQIYLNEHKWMEIEDSVSDDLSTGRRMLKVGGQRSEYRYQTADGLLVGADGHKYQIEESSGSATPQITKLSSDGKVEASYKYDYMKMTSERTSGDGSRISRSYIGTPGADYGKPREVSSTDEAGQKRVIRFYYGDSGFLLRKVQTLNGVLESDERFVNGVLSRSIARSSETEYAVDKLGRRIVKVVSSGQTAEYYVSPDGTLTIGQ